MSTLYEEHTQYNNDLFKRYVSIYDYVESILFSVRGFIVQQLNNQNKVLDVACGTGSLSLLLAQKGHNVVGVDISEDMLEVAEKKLEGFKNASFLCREASQLPFRTGSFDSSVISFGLHDMPELIAIGVLKEMKRVTKKGGRIVIADYNTDSQLGVTCWIGQLLPIVWESKYYKHFLQRGLEYYLKEVGLEIDDKYVLIQKTLQVVVCRKK